MKPLYKQLLIQIPLTLSVITSENAAYAKSDIVFFLNSFVFCLSLFNLKQSEMKYLCFPSLPLWLLRRCDHGSVACAVTVAGCLDT
jgi:hypothetical protein